MHVFTNQTYLEETEAVIPICIILNYALLIKYFVFSKDFKIFRTLASLCSPSVSVCVHTHKAGRTPALQANCQSSENLQIFKEKHII